METHEARLIRKMRDAKRGISTTMQQAVIDVLVHGSKWRTAAIKHDVTESGIWRCVHRLGLRSTIVDTK